MSGNAIDGEKLLVEKGMPNRYSAVFSGNPVRITREYMDSLLIEMRHIGAAAEPSVEMELFGERFKTPVMTAALSGLDGICPDAMTELAKGAAAAGAVMWLGIGGEEELAAAAGAGARVIKIIKPYADTNLIFEKIQQAEKHGALAVGMDIDFFFGSKRKKGVAMEYPVSPKTADELKSYVRASRLPFILKGVLSGHDAEKALETGAAGIVVSHHGGAVQDYAVPPLMALPRIKKIIGGKIPIFVDCGIAGGADVFKSLALGAKAVSAGRVLMAGLAAEGAEGVTRVINTITGELQWTMKHTACAALDTITPDLIWGGR
jgi:isopentenyl diphosphate isomerase/L-lactate dehydrogenase-like FMN-dependent dehydrogenase